MSGFEKIEIAQLRPKHTTQVLQKNKKPQIIMAVRKGRLRKKYLKIFLIAFAVIIALFALVSIPAYATYKSGLETYRQAKVVLGAVKNQNIALASGEIGKTKKSLQETRKNFNRLIFLKFIPVVNWYYNDADHLLKAGENALESGTIVINSIEPYADVLGLKGQGSFTMGSAEERIKTAVMTIGKITPQIDKLAKSLINVRKEIDEVNPDHYPEFIFGKKVKAQLTSVREMTDMGVTFIDQARPLVKLLPSLLGESKEKKYLVLFQNDKELRPTGGFITAYAVFRIDKGVIKLERSEDIYKLDNSVPRKEKAPAPILKYLDVKTFNLRDSNLSPDYVESMKTFKAMYDRAGERTNVDGIIALDTSVLVSTIKILDDQVTAGGLTFTTKEDKRCDCPQVIYELEDNISRPVGYIREDRKGLLGDLLSAIMQKALSSSPELYWGPLFQSFITETNQKHVLFYLYDTEAQKGIEALNAAGRIKEDFEGDYLHINETSFSGAKVNIFLEQEVENKYEVKNDGSIVKTVTINYKNPYPPSDCNLERGGLCLNAEYRDWFRIYVPKGSELVDSKGSQVKVTSSEDLGKTVFEGFLTVRPKGIAKFTITYKLPFKLPPGSPLPVLIQKQPGTYNIQYTTIVNGKTVKSFPLLTDKEARLKI